MSTSRPAAVATVRVLLVDDHPDVRFVLRAQATRDPDCSVEIVGEAADGRAAVDAAARLRPDVILLDVRMPKLDGIAALPALRTVAPDARIVMYSSSETRREEALRRGADGWVSKTAGWDEVRRHLLPG